MKTELIKSYDVENRQDYYFSYPSFKATNVFHEMFEIVLEHREGFDSLFKKLQEGCKNKKSRSNCRIESEEGNYIAFYSPKKWVFPEFHVVKLKDDKKRL